MHLDAFPARLGSISTFGGALTLSCVNMMERWDLDAAGTITFAAFQTSYTKHSCRYADEST